MRGFRTIVLATASAICISPAVGAAVEFPDFNRDPAQSRIVTEDLDRFWCAWDLAEADPENRREIFQREYLDAGTPGLQAFVELRIQDVDRLLRAIDAYPRYYASLRATMPEVKQAAKPIRNALFKLHGLMPDAVFPDTYLLIGAMNSGGTIHFEGALIGAEMYGMTPDTPTEELGSWHRAVVDRPEKLPAIVVHELIHFQQFDLTRSAPPGTLLGMAIHEGAADFVAELALDTHISQNLHEWALPREAELWAEFSEVMHGEDHSGWLYQGDKATDRPADLGYFIGYRIAQAYYEQAEDKRAAVREILGMTDPEELLARSGYASRFTYE